MDYDENDFQNHNLHLAGEGSNKFPPVLLPYALPKFDFDDGLNGSLRFDSLVETEVFLGIESNVDNQWIEDFSRGTSGIQFSSSAAESCSLSRHNNVWSEATSSESVEMLLKSVGQEDNTPVQTNTKGSDACDELGCILKHMDPILKQDSDTSPKVEDTANLQAKFLPGEDVEDFSVLDNDVGQQQPLDDSSQDHKGEASADSGLVPLVDLSAISVEVRQPVIEGSLSNDSNSNHVTQREVDNVENGPSNDMPQKGPGSGMQDGATLHNITTGNMELTEKDGPDDIDNTCDAHKNFLETNTGENQKKGHVLSQEGQMEDENPCSDAMESVEEANIIETNLSNFGEPLCIIPKGHSGFPEDVVTSGQSEVDIVGGSMMAIEDNISFERHEIEDSNGSHLDNKSLSNKCEASILSSESCEPAKVKVGGTSNSNTGGVSCLVAVCCSAEVVGEEARVPSPFLAESSQICGKSMAPAEGKDTIELPSGNIGFSPLDKEKETTDKISAEASLSGLETSCQLIAGLDPGPESKKGASSGAAGQLVCESAEQSPLMVDACKTEGSEVIDKVSLESTKEMDVCPVLCDSTANKGDDAEVTHMIMALPFCVFFNAEPTVNENEMLGPISSEKEDFREDTNQKGQEENEAAIASEDNNCGSCADIGKAASGSPTVIRAAGDFQSESDKEGAKCSVEQTAVADSNASKALSGSRDPKQNDASKDERSFTFEVSPLANMPEKEAGNKWQPFLNRPATKAYPILNASPSSGLVQIDPKLAQDGPCGSPKVSDVAIARSGSKGTSERKTRRPSAKAMGKESARKGNPIKDTASVRLEKGAKTNNVSPSPSGILQHVQSNEMQRYGHVDSSTMKPFVNASSTSSLPDLNSSASPSVMFQQPFTDLQQVQLRAQIFVYGALIQGTAPDEAYMISAFGGSDGGKSSWENALRSSIERLHGQNPHLTTPETPLQSRPGSRALDQTIKQSAIQSTIISSPIGRTSKGTPTIVNPMVPLSSPLWSVPTPTGDTFQSSSMPRGPIMDHHRAFSPMHTHQTSQIRNFAGNSWISQAPFCGPWATSPQTPVLDTSCHFSAQLPITEPVQLTPVKDLSMPIISGANHVSPGPAIQIGASASVFTGTFPVPDAKKVAAPSSQPRTDPKPRKRKKTPFSESPGQNILHPHPQTESVPALVVTSHPSTSAAITTPVIYVSKPLTEKFVASVSPTPTDIIKGNQNAEQRNMLSEETLDKVKAARVQAEDAATLAAAAVNHSLEIWNRLDEQKNSGLSLDVETKLASAAVAIAAAAAVARAAAAAAKVASNAALQAKLLADEAVNSGGYSNPSQDNTISVSEGMKNLGKATPASILKGDDGTNSSSSILVVAREAARRRVEVASAAAKRAENTDAIVKAAELAAEAVSQAGKIVAMGAPSPLNELVAVGPEGYWKVAKINNEVITKSNAIGRKNLNIDRVGEGPYAPTEVSTEDHARLEDGFLNSGAAAAKDVKGQEGGYKVSESENSSRSLGTMENYNSIKEGSHVEVFKDGNGFKAAWFSANVVDLKDGSAYVSYTDLSSVEGEERAPKIRIARPITAVQFEGTRKRRRAATVDRIWSVGDRVDAWIQDSWREGVVIERTKNDDTTLKVQFPAQGETSVVRAWHLRSSLLWENGEWIEWSGSKVGSHSTKGAEPSSGCQRKHKLSKGFDSVETDRHDEPTLLDLAAHEKLFNIGKSTKDGNKPEVLRMARTGLQKEGSRVIFGVPKPGKKRKFMEVSKHYVADQSSKNNEANDSVKFAKYLMPQGSRSRGWKSTLRTESIANRTVASKPKALKSGKPRNVSGRTITPKDNSLTTTVSASNDGAVTDHDAKTKASISHVENTSEKHNVTGFHPISSSVGATEGPVFSSFPLPSGTLSSKKIPKPQRVSKGKLAPAGGKLGRIEEDKIFNGDSSKSTSDATEPRRSNRKIQPTSRLLEGLQSSLMVSKTPSVSHDKSQKSRTASRGNISLQNLMGIPALVE
ncbi:WISKOTT-ALDRICH SYNDROME PROTEIN [Salix suchowensis]|nr:WISKOTT-ALDRICH SYNDROME PROTEIN [Salix suchowensis]